MHPHCELRVSLNNCFLLSFCSHQLHVCRDSSVRARVTRGHTTPQCLCGSLAVLETVAPWLCGGRLVLFLAGALLFWG